MTGEMKKPELLAPAGDMERLYAAVKYGADAVYLAGKTFGMRAAPANFSDEQLHEAVAFSHEHGVKVYLTCNVLPRNDELAALPSFLLNARDAGVDALIISDMGVLQYAKKYVPELEIHISTQTGIVNYAAANAFYQMGAKRIVTARELKLTEISEIRKNIPEDMDIECFVHGAMCVSFSGRCLISNYLVGRDANAGECAQPCRWKYQLVEEKRPGQYFPVYEGDGGTYIMNSKDMCMIEHIPEMIRAGITSFKIEGRAKSTYYVSVVTNAYRKAIDGYLSNPSDSYVPEQWILDEMKKISYRDYCTGFFYGDPRDDANISYQGGYNREWDVAAVVERWENGVAYCVQRNRFFLGDELEAMEVGKPPFKVKVLDLRNGDGEAIEATNHPMMRFSFRCERPLEAETILRKERDEAARVII
ncbi:MAG: U32 family peptidase [Oscillospiraceae bacterium]|nr:U32 family peptidase [Oscillospiraceae bacterium]